MGPAGSFPWGQWTRSKPPCPGAGASDRDAARTVALDDVLGWAMLCNGPSPWSGRAHEAGTGVVSPSRH
ncbi:DUF5999 family protein [Streptomyces sp. NPDC057543]|uniref:DUF5999 family protein n=1 Tax=Streptomyces sp. NPDC057543 TaxID=3346163 RepID=UPI003678379C